MYQARATGSSRGALYAELGRHRGEAAVDVGARHWRMRWVGGLDAWLSSCALIVGTVLFGVAGLYPNLLPSSLDPAASTTAFNASSSPLTLQIMLGVVLRFLPVVIGYQIWVHLRFRDTITAKSVEDGPAY